MTDLFVVGNETKENADVSVFSNQEIAHTPPLPEASQENTDANPQNNYEPMPESSSRLKSPEPTPAQPTVSTTTSSNETSSIGLFSSFVRNPDNIHLVSDSLNEKPVLFLRSHMIVNIPWIVSVLLLILITPVILLANQHYNPFPFITPNYLFVLTVFYLLIVATAGFIYFLGWSYNLTIITTERIIDVTFAALVYKKISETSFEHLEDVDYTPAGLLRSMFNYGDVMVQTAGAVDEFSIASVPHPNEVANILEIHIKDGQHEQ